MKRKAKIDLSDHDQQGWDIYSPCPEMSGEVLKHSIVSYINKGLILFGNVILIVNKAISHMGSDE